MASSSLPTDTATPTTTFTLLDLNDEVLTTIINHVRDLRTTMNLSKTCRRIHQLSRTSLYREIHIRDESDAFLLGYLIDRDPTRASLVKDLVVASVQGIYIENFDNMEWFADELPNLQSVFISRVLTV